MQAFSLPDHAADHAKVERWWAAFLDRFHRHGLPPALTWTRRDTVAAVARHIRTYYPDQDPDQLWRHILDCLEHDDWYSVHPEHRRVEVIFNGVSSAEKIDRWVQQALNPPEQLLRPALRSAGDVLAEQTADAARRRGQR